MKTLLVLRHGKASRESSEGSDHERPLKKKGAREAEAVGKHLREHQLLPDKILCSTAERARATAELALSASGSELPVELLSELYLAEPPAYLGALRRHAAEAQCVLVVGHNPGLEALVQMLTGEQRVLGTGALVVCELSVASFADLSDRGTNSMGRLLHVFQPHED